MIQPDERSPAAIGCSAFIFAAVILGGIWIFLVLVNDFNRYLVGFCVILCAYVLRYARYIFIKANKDEFIRGRQTCFLVFPCLSNILLLIIWYLSHNWLIAVSLSIIAGWLLAKALQASLFAHEYTYRDNPEDRVIEPLDKRFTKQWMNASLLNTKGIMLAQQGQFEEAQKMFEQAIEIEPDYPHARISISNVLLHYGRYSQAEFQLNKAIELGIDDKNIRNAWNNLGNIRVAQMKYQEAKEFYEKAIDVYQPDYEIYCNLGISCEQLGEWNDALKYYQLSNKIHNNIKAKTAAERIEQRIWHFPETKKILDSFLKKWNIQYPNCGNNSLSDHELNKLQQIREAPLVFLVGAGISHAAPSCLPLAAQILKAVFHIIYELDRNVICQILNLDILATEDELYKQISLDLSDNEKDKLPFEATFQALYDCFGFPVIRFVDLLKRGKPNLHHIMLAHAIKNGHTVITTNFDKKIEEAYKICFNNKEISKVLVTDKDFQEAIENKPKCGVLAKIHGDLSDYNSLALTLTSVAISCDHTIYYGDDIDSDMAKKQLKDIHPRTLLSIPKALFLQREIKENKIVVMGYSGSDEFDIMPILMANEFHCRGLWIEHTRELPKTIKKWMENAQEREVLKRDSNEKEEKDITSRVSRFFLDTWGYAEDSTFDDIGTDGLNILFRDWIDRLRLRPGDGLACMAGLYNQRGKWNRAELFFEAAIEKYFKDKVHNEQYWLATQLILGYTYDQTEQRDRAIETAINIQNYIEKNRKQDIYPSLYANTLNNIAVKWINTDKDEKAGLLVDKAMKIGEEIDDKHVLCNGLRIAADRYLGQKKYKKALELYLEVLHISSDVLGNLREACLSSMHAAICLAHMGQQYSASKLLADSENFANYLGDAQLIDGVKHNQGFIIGRYHGESPTWKYHEELFNAAKKQVNESVRKEFDELGELIVSEKYEQALDWIQNLLDRYYHPDVHALLLFLKSNIFQRTRRLEEEIEVLTELCRIKPDNPLFEHNLGGAYSRTENYKLGEKNYLRAIEIMGGNYPLAYCNLGVMYAKMGDIEKAHQQLLKAIELKAPENSLEALKRRISELEKQKE